jgi:4'-phosphopantetheinyl transferase
VGLLSSKKLGELRITGRDMLVLQAITINLTICMATSAELHLFKLNLKRETRNYNAYIGFSSLSPSFLDAQKAYFLQPSEIATYESIQSDRRKKSFLQGRYIAKEIVSAYLQEEDLTKIGIKSGVFNQPLVVYPSQSSPLISIAHTNQYAVCLVFPDEHPMGIDLEQIGPTAKEDISSQMTLHEQRLNTDEEENTFYTRLWSVKESLSKVLKTGLLIPLEILEIATMQVKEGYTVSTFTNFIQYKTLSFFWKNQICSITLPKETNFEISSLLDRRIE